MQIRLSDLRRIIREVLEEQSWVPGRWYPSKGEPVDKADIQLMSQAGLGKSSEDESESESKKKENEEV